MYTVNMNSVQLSVTDEKTIKIRNQRSMDTSHDPMNDIFCYVRVLYT